MKCTPLEELLMFLKELDLKKDTGSLTSSLNKILIEDKKLLTKLAQ